MPLYRPAQEQEQQQKPSLLRRLTTGILGPGQSYGGLLSEEDQRAAQQQGLLALGAQLMAAGGPSPVPTSFGQALGPALQAGQQAQLGHGQDMLQGMLLKTKLQRAGQGTNKTHVVGNALVDDTGTVVYQGQALDNVYGRVNPGDFTPASLAKFEKSKNWSDLERVWAPVNPTVQLVNGVPTVVQPSRTGAPTTTDPLSTLPSEIAAAGQLKQAQSASGALGTAQGEIAGGIQKKGSEAVTGGNILDIAEPLIDVATGSGPGAARDAVAAFFGKATTGSEAIGQLQVLQAALMLNQPRMEGPQGEKDVELYQRAAGQIGDPRIPGPIKKAAMQTIRRLQDTYKERAAAQDAGSNIDALLDKYAPKK